MIKKIVKLESFGIFKDFEWEGLDEFKDGNLIYGWNYSGKTTLSKLFQLLEYKGTRNFFENQSFELLVDDGGTDKTINQNNIDDFPFYVKVFNSEYIKSVFTWDDPGSDIDAISFYLGEQAGDIKKEIKSLEKRNDRLSCVKENRYQKLVDVFENYNKVNGEFSVKAKDIRENYIPNVFQTHEFNKTHFKEEVELVKASLNQFLLDEKEKKKFRTEALAKKDYEEQKFDINYPEKLDDLANKTKHLLEETAPKVGSFPELDNDQELFEWVQKGTSIHSDEEYCKFCENKLPENRIKNLNAYYSNKLKEIQDSLRSVLSKIDQEQGKLGIKFPDKRNLAEIFRKEYIQCTEKFEELEKNYKKQLKILENDISRKKENIFNSISSTTVEEISFSNVVDKIESILKEHNNWLSDFEKRKKIAINKLVKHYIAEYINKEDYVSKEKAFKTAQTAIGKIDSQISANRVKITELENKLRGNLKGKKELNKSLRVLLNRDDIKIQIENDRFILERNGYPASNLSEGEKSAIAFSYFFTELKSYRDDDPPKLCDSIIFIDDPISSLDSNHIFQVRSMIKTFFKKEDFTQLFISTHNFEFFSVLYDSGIVSRTQKEVNRPLYFLRRSKSEETSIIKMPKSFSNYKSEYVGLYHILKEFHDEVDKSNYPYLLLLPNALRRFLELYTLSKYPSDNNTSLDKRIELIFNFSDKTYHSTKLLHWFSHQNQVEKLHQHDGKILQIDSAIEELFNYIKNEDQLHWKGLNNLN